MILMIIMKLLLVSILRYYGENEFSTMLAYKAGLSILNGNIQSINAKFDDFQSFVSRVNTSHPISAIFYRNVD